MTGTDSFSDGTQALLELARSKLRVRGRSLDMILSRARRRMPRRVASAMGRLVAAQAQAENPRLALMLDQASWSKDIEEVRAYLDELDPSDERKGWYLGILASLVINLLTLIVLLIAVMIWRGYL